MARTTLNILIGGAAGQGMATIGHALGKALVRKGYHLHATQTIHSRIRGGHNTFALRIADAPVAAPVDAIDILLALNAESLSIHRGALAPDHRILADARTGEQGGDFLALPLAELARGGHVNTALLGAVGYVLGIDSDELSESLSETLGLKTDAIKAKNKEILEKTYAWAAARALPPAPGMLKPALPPRGRLFMNGHEAVALGALSAGLKFCSFYPISPATGVPLAIASAAKEMGVIVEQGEDELAVINMALGASFAGAPAMTATSGAGLSLMAEGISLAGISETPVVILIGMRPGPATGLATRTEQADLDQAVSVGHGEFPRAVFAPASLEDCFQLTRHAFMLAERFQGPVFLLTDQYLADSYRDVEPFFLDALPQVPLPEPSDDRSYQRYAFMEDGISPRALPGAGKALVCLNSYEHTPGGRLTEDLPLRERMNEKRLAKMGGLVREVIPPALSGPDAPEYLLVCWGSSLGAVSEAARRLTAAGTPTGVCHFTQVYPLRPDQFLGPLRSAKQVIAVESNATGQLARQIRCHSGFSVHAHIGRWDGLALTCDYILGKLSALRAG